jgi:hypothetical protein
MEDNIKKKIKKEDDLQKNGRRPQIKHGRRPQKMEDNLKKNKKLFSIPL